MCHLRADAYSSKHLFDQFYQLVPNRKIDNKETGQKVCLSLEICFAENHSLKTHRIYQCTFKKPYCSLYVIAQHCCWLCLQWVPLAFCWHIALLCECNWADSDDSFQTPSNLNWIFYQTLLIYGHILIQSGNFDMIGYLASRLDPQLVSQLVSEDVSYTIPMFT